MLIGELVAVRKQVDALLQQQTVLLKMLGAGDVGSSAAPSAASAVTPVWPSASASSRGELPRLLCVFL